MSSDWLNKYIHSKIKKKKIHFKSQSESTGHRKSVSSVINLRVRCPVFLLTEHCILPLSSLRKKLSTRKLKIILIIPKNEQFPLRPCLHY